jgi:multidrug efflux pump subunit AcrA (membrane-fusion protein)
VGDIPVRVGDRVTTSTTLTTIDKPGSLEAYVYVPIERSPDLKRVWRSKSWMGAASVIASSQVSFISPEVDSSTQAVLVKATIANNNDKLRNAQFIRARMVWGRQQETVVPMLSVSRVGAQYFAFVAESQNGKMVAHQRPLRVGTWWTTIMPFSRASNRGTKSSFPEPSFSSMVHRSYPWDDLTDT